jgi:hypothetical protein
MNVLYLLPLPDDIITKILLYDENYVLIQGKLVHINKLLKKDSRYQMLEKKPLLYINKGADNSVTNSITIYNDILETDIFEQYLIIYKTVQMYKHF